MTDNTDKQKINTNSDVSLNLNIKDTPEDIAKSIVDGFLIPILNRKTQVSGFHDSEKAFFNMLFLMISERIKMVGTDAIGEMHSLLEDLESVWFEEPVEKTLVVNPVDYFVQSGQVS